ncbi:RTA1 like protein-domain-containing protein [Talaromyces proteolyticus]|uniref:RTA1 like protein-domain-containing protein n=1 Tax=Talaromyces proteolyticus TaxID=1131652 RepID=A0AAD4PXH0_9EURO|nr:RTA1 like protein-domain-containing protein [Talaromyces proteolyticus]KAH8693655.1 RTA1 like protein-domain-containing protein [Talaromyces proteolyticus]
MNSTNSTADIPVNSIGNISFTPLYAPNVIFTVIFSLLLLAQIILTTVYYRFYGYATGMLGGLLLELLGYAAKVMLSHDRGNKNGYIMYIIGLTLGPTFLSSSLYLSISAILRHYQATCLRPVGPRLFSTLFITGDFICLCFIGIGGSLAAIYAEDPIGVDLMIAGLATQVLFTAIFCVVLSILRRDLRQRLVEDGRKWFMIGLLVAAACLFIRSCWRVAELSDGFNGPLASMEGVFIALDSIPMVIMSVLLTVLHPRRLGRGHHVLG